MAGRSSTRVVRAADTLNDPAVSGLDADEAAALNALLHRALAATHKSG